MKNHFMGNPLSLSLLAFQAIIIGTLTSCVSVEVPFGPVPKSEKAHAPKPNPPFVAFPTSTADEAWISEKTGNTISYLSECKKNEERIEDVALDAARAIEQARILKTTRGTIDSKPTSELLVAGKVDSHPVKMALAVFRDKDCLFSLTYGGLEENFNKEAGEFEAFKEGFRVP